MTGFELAYLCAEPFLPPLYAQVRRELRVIAGSHRGTTPEMVDIGGRKSHYTIGVPACFTITELPRVTPTQVDLNLGLTVDGVEEVHARRSNVRRIMYDDMTRTALPAQSFDCAVAVEVIEHVDDDRGFVENVRRVLRPDGVFLLTTPNGDSVPIPYNSDHRRHYTRANLSSLLRTVFRDVDVRYAIASGAMRRVGLQSWSVRHPVRTIASMGANVINAAQSARTGVTDRAQGTRHLIATARGIA